MSDTPLLTPVDLGITPAQVKELKPLDVASEDFKLKYIQEALELNNWNKAKTARALNVDPRTIFRYIEKLNQ